MIAVVLAGERPGPNPLATAGSVPCKALLKVGGQPMIARVVEALLSSRSVTGVLLCGPTPEVAHHAPVMIDLLRDERVRWVPPAETPATSVQAALATLPDTAPVLITTADHVLLRPEIVDTFVGEAQSTPADIVAGVTEVGPILDAFPGMKKTTHRMRDGAWCGCNLFLMKTTRGQRVISFWQRIEALRKHPLRAARLIGWSFLGRYLTRSMTLDQATGHIGGRTNASVATVKLPFPDAGVDVDSIDDWQIIERAFAEASANGEGS